MEQGPAVHHSLANGTLHSWRVLSSVSSIMAASSPPQRIVGRLWPDRAHVRRLSQRPCLWSALALVLDLRIVFWRRLKLMSKKEAVKVWGKKRPGLLIIDYISLHTQVLGGGCVKVEAFPQEVVVCILTDVVGFRQQPLPQH